MSYISNINSIEVELKKIFNKVEIDRSDYRNIIFNLSESSSNEKLKMKITVSQKNLNLINPKIEWGYYTNPNKLDNLIKYNSPIENISTIVESIIFNNRFDKEYLLELKKEDEELSLINEGSVENIEIDVEINNINQIYELRESVLIIDSNKLRLYMNSISLDVNIDDISVEYTNPINGKIRKSTFLGNDLTILGDEAEISIKGISTFGYDGNITPSIWLEFQLNLQKIPFTENVNISTHDYSCYITFSDKVMVELI